MTPEPQMPRCIVKIQRALYPPDANLLLYNEDRSFEVVIAPIPEALMPFVAEMGADPKVYVYAELRADGTLDINGEAPPQDW